MIDLSKCLLTILAYPDSEVKSDTFFYFCDRGLPLSNIVVIGDENPIIVNRNLIMRDIILPRKDKFEWMIFIDKDNIPKRGLTDPFLDEVDFDVVGCMYPLKNPGAWSLPEVFHMGLTRMRPEAIQKVTPPWFLYEYNEDGTRLKGCECSYMRNKLREQEVTMTRRGWISHDEHKQTWHSSA